MKLLFLTEFFPGNDKLVYTGGVEVRTFQIVKRASKDFKTQVISRPSQLVPATWISIFPRIFYLFSSFFKVLFSNFDLIEASNFVTYLPAFFAGKLKKKKTIAWIADVLGQDWFKLGFLVGSFGYLVEKISLKLPWDHFIALSQSTKSKLLKSGIKTKKISVVKAGIDPQEFVGKPEKKFQSFTIICIARLVNTKRIQDLITAFSHLDQGQLIIIGQGPREKSLRKLTNSLNLDNSVKFLKNLTRAELLKNLKKSHLFCLPSLVEGFGIVTIEAMAAGLPTVIADIPVNQEITNKGQGALLFQPQNTQDLADKISQLLSNQTLYQQKKHQTIKLSQQYSWSKIYQQTKKVYETCYSS